MFKIVVAFFALALATSSAQAQVTRVQIDSREALPGTFGAAGAYEVLRGRIYGELNPSNPLNAIITDISLADRNPEGRVEYSATFALTKPLDMSRASGFLIYDVPNRGLTLPLTGDPEGHVHLVSGWQSDLTPAQVQQTLTAPIAHHPDGAPITGPILVRFLDMPAGTQSLPIQGGVTGILTWARPEPLSLDTGRARLLRRREDSDRGEIVPPTDWAFADCSRNDFPGEPDSASLCLRDGFDPIYAYELTYVGKDPLVQGIGFAAVRDAVAFFHSAQSTDDAPNPVAGEIRWTLGVGYSQSGNFLRSFINLGFNTGLNGQRVFDGIMPLIAARQVPLNVRFGVPGGTAELYEPGSDGVLWWGDYEDASRGLPASGLLSRCRDRGDCPKVFDVFGSAEFWGLRKSADLLGPDSAVDIPEPANVRRYYLPSITHGGGAGGFPTDVTHLPGVPGCVLPANPNPASYTIRALTRRLTAWIAEGAAPPDSVIPTLVHGDLVEPTSAAMGFPTIPHAPTPDGKANDFLVYDFGREFLAADLSGRISRQPPLITARHAAYVPRVNGDGNEMVGVASVQLRVPLGSYLGWNERASGYYGGAGCAFQGGYVPFAVTRAEREATGDPRPSLEERYGDHDGFVARVREASAAMMSEGFLLPEDAGEIERQAAESAVLR